MLLPDVILFIIFLSSKPGRLKDLKKKKSMLRTSEVNKQVGGEKKSNEKVVHRMHKRASFIDKESKTIVKFRILIHLN